MIDRWITKKSDQWRSKTWDFWRQIPKLPLWQAVVLTTGFEPRDFEGSSGAVKQIDDGPFYCSLPSCQERLAIAEAHLGQTGLKPAWINMGDPGDSGVWLVEFSVWAAGMGWDMPQELSVLATNETVQIPDESPKEYEVNKAEHVGVTVTLPHITKSLDAIFRIMWDNWSGYDSKRLPKQINIAREIDTALGWGKKGDINSDPSRDAKAIAKIIKPDSFGETE